MQIVRVHVPFSGGRERGLHHYEGYLAFVTDPGPEFEPLMAASTPR
jgi:hypothetical protein